MAERRPKEEGRWRNRVRVSLTVAEELGRGLVLLVSLAWRTSAPQKVTHISEQRELDRPRARGTYPADDFRGRFH